jgi:DNA-binding transcriptional LysR family regulator
MGGTIVGRIALDDLAVFATVAGEASFVGASRRLGVPKSTVSRAVSRLEEELGVALLVRTSRRVSTTEEGRQLLQRVGPHVDGLREAVATLADREPEPSGTLRVTAPAFTGATRIARALADFAVAHPKVRVELDTANVIRDLLQDGFDLGVRVGGHADADFVSRLLLRGELGLFASRELVRKALRGKTRLSRAELERTPAVVLRPGAVWRFVDAEGEALAVAPHAVFAVNDPRATVDVARRGLGIVLAPVEAVPSRGAEALVRLSTDFGAPAPIDLHLVYPTRRLLPSRVRLAIDWLLRACRAPAKRGKGGAKGARRRADHSTAADSE